MPNRTYRREKGEGKNQNPLILMAGLDNALRTTKRMSSIASEPIVSFEGSIPLKKRLVRPGISPWSPGGSAPVVASPAVTRSKGRDFLLSDGGGEAADATRGGRGFGAGRIVDMAAVMDLYRSQRTKEQEKARAGASTSSGSRLEESATAGGEARPQKALFHAPRKVFRIKALRRECGGGGGGKRGEKKTPLPPAKRSISEPAFETSPTRKDGGKRRSSRPATPIRSSSLPMEVNGGSPEGRKVCDRQCRSRPASPLSLSLQLASLSGSRRRSRRGNSSLCTLAESIATKCNVVFITGAGLSVPSGVRPFRGRDGLWSEVVWSRATRENFRRDPLGWYNDFWLRHFPPEAAPNFLEGWGLGYVDAVACDG